MILFAWILFLSNVRPLLWYELLLGSTFELPLFSHIFTLKVSLFLLFFFRETLFLFDIDTSIIKYLFHLMISENLKTVSVLLVSISLSVCIDISHSAVAFPVSVIICGVCLYHLFLLLFHSIYLASSIFKSQFSHIYEYISY